MAAAYAGVLGLCDRGCLRRGGRCDPDRRAGPPRRDPYDRHARVLRPAGARAYARAGSLEPLELDRKRRESRRDWRRLGGGGLAGADEAREHFRLTIRPFDLVVLCEVAFSSAVMVVSFLAKTIGFKSTITRGTMDSDENLHFDQLLLPVVKTQLVPRKSTFKSQNCSSQKFSAD